MQYSLNNLKSISRLKLVACLFILLPLVCEAQMQPFLLLEKPGTKKRIRYYTGDDISFKLEDQPNFNEGHISGFRGSLFYVGQGTPILLKDVEAVADRSKVPGVRKWSKGVLLVVPSFFVFSAANNYFNTGRRPIVDPEVWVLAGVFAAIGGSGMLYNGRKYRLKNRWRLIVVDH
ncbi:MAG: hypothetical protein ABR572_02205 [Cryomorphaceae bacterium]